MTISNCKCIRQDGYLECCEECRNKELAKIFHKRMDTVHIAQFKEELRQVINRFSMENGSDTPDFVLTEYLYDCLMNFNKATISRDLYYNPPKQEK